jgi:hypothetical protein
MLYPYIQEERNNHCAATVVARQAGLSPGWTHCQSVRRLPTCPTKKATLFSLLTLDAGVTSGVPRLLSAQRRASGKMVESAHPRELFLRGS